MLWAVPKNLYLEAVGLRSPDGATFRLVSMSEPRELIPLGSKTVGRAWALRFIFRCPHSAIAAALLEKQNTWAPFTSFPALQGRNDRQ